MSRGILERLPYRTQLTARDNIVDTYTLQEAYPYLFNSSHL